MDAHPELRITFNSCAHWLVEFSDIHMALTHAYIAQQEETSAANPNSVGTAGSSYATYLQEHRDDRALVFV